MSYSETDIDWAQIETQNVRECGESLCRLVATPRLRLLPMYFQNGIDGALPEIWLRQTLAEKLLRVVARLPENIALVVLDGWRPLAVQRALRAIMRAEIEADFPHETPTQIMQRLNRFAADPDRAKMCPPHLTGGSVDVALLDAATGVFLDMGSAFDETGWRSYTMALADEADFQAAHARRMMLLDAMHGEGFTNLPTEWWHFDYGNANWAFFGHHECAIYGATQPENQI